MGQGPQPPHRRRPTCALGHHGGGRSPGGGPREGPPPSAAHPASAGPDQGQRRPGWAGSKRPGQVLSRDRIAARKPLTPLARVRIDERPQFTTPLPAIGKPAGPPLTASKVRRPPSATAFSSWKSSSSK